jgi:hypothetical protein
MQLLPQGRRKTCPNTSGPRFNAGLPCNGSQTLKGALPCGQEDS